MTKPTDLNSLPLPELFRVLTSSGALDRLLALAREEDLGTAGDITSAACFPNDAPATAALMARAEGVLCGLETIPAVLRAFDCPAHVDLHAHDGDPVRRDQRLATFRAPLRALLQVERAILNLIGRLSGVATQTRRYCLALGQGHHARLFDTRKTTPGLRALEKYAVRCGGGYCHRIGLFDALLIKDNHLAGVSVEFLASHIQQCVQRARATQHPIAFSEVEVDSLAQLQAILTLPHGVVDIVLLDNMKPPILREACALRDRLSPGLLLEASGGVTLDTLRDIALTGVDRISVGALTHSAVQLDVALDVEA